MKTIFLAGGCFWGMQKYFDQFEGVIRTEAGYANGPDSQPTYEEVCDNSGHAETVRIDFDENTISLTRLLQYYFLVINPTSINRQGNDIGIQYRTGIYYTQEDQLAEINAEYKRQEKITGAKACSGGAACKELLPCRRVPPEVPRKEPGRILSYPGQNVFPAKRLLRYFPESSGSG